jgi:hypothetical protein
VRNWQAVRHDNSHDRDTKAPQKPKGVGSGALHAPGTPASVCVRLSVALSAAALENTQDRPQWPIKPHHGGRRSARAAADMRLLTQLLLVPKPGAMGIACSA